MQYIMMPLDAHYDSGFGAIAVSFRDAALALRKTVPKPAFFDHLPQSYLFRHATELFLKSGIVILHRKLKLPYGTEPYNGAPMVGVKGEWRPLHRVHSVGVLYEYWKSLIDPRLEELKEMTKYKTDWRIVDGAGDWIATIESVDPRSTYSRYPSVRDPAEDQSKSPFKAVSAEELFPKNVSDGRRVMALIIENDDHEFVGAYINDKGPEPDDAYMDALECICEMLNSYHAMMRFELTGGF
jgi:hypothetical protein